MKKILLIIILVFPVLSYGQSKDAYVKAGDICLAKEDPYSAIGHYQAALNYDEDDAVVHLKLSNAYLKISDYSNALYQSEQTRRLSKDNVILRAAYIRSTELLKRAGRFDEAIALLTDAKDSYFSAVINEINLSKLNANDTANYYLQQLPSSINTGNSEFAPIAISDSILIYSSHRFPLKEDEQTVYSKILTSKIKNGIYESGMPLPNSINTPEFSNGNASISPDGQILIYTRCQYNDSNQLICDLYESTLKNGKYTTPKKLGINVDGYTNTQPCITTHLLQGYQLYFASNRPGGYGGNDLYTCFRGADGKYSAIKNLGEKINTSSNEATPYFNLNNDSLYFSSDKAGGLGGFDIYQVSMKDTSVGPVHLPVPYNSGYNDLYYSSSYGINSLTYVVSNRPPAGKLNVSACCIDVFEVKKMAVDSSKYKNQTENNFSQLKLKRGLGDNRFQFNDSISKEDIIATLRELLPLNLYFDNDYPDPKTRKTSTDSRYQQLVNDYLNREGEYSLMQGDSQKAVFIKQFFSDSVYGNFQRLELICGGLKKVLSNEQNVVIKLKVEGSASSLATDAYNVTLSSRRISSIFNYWGEWNDGVIKKAIENRQIEVTKNPKGEMQATGRVSDDANNQALSVFSLEAALERKIIITDLSIELKNEIK
ncbi:MAG: hypothetical protein ACKOX3_06200 [Bacteroidota bacterium]